ncbi:MAG: ATP-binding cassette domain-containing protein, partial [Betaproteobacteria bacterium]|nr:ATP-binding cassette domain-containing protein [Betaproteobacteria bacterium]
MVAVLMFTLTAVLILAPVGYLVFGSLRSASPLTPDAVFTGANWLKVYGAGVYRTALLNTVLLGGTVALLSLVLGGILAWIVARTDAPWAGQLALPAVVPLMISNLITTLAWIALAAPRSGFINASFDAWFGTGTIFDIYSFSGIVLVLVMHYTAFAFVAVYAALRSVDGALEEASYMLGAGPVTTGLRMTLPLIWPTIAAAFLMIFVLVAENFHVPTLLGAPVGFQTLPTQIYVDMTVEPSQPPLAAAAGTMLLWIALCGTLWQRRILARASRYVTIGGKGSRQRLAGLGAWKYAATGLLLLYIFFAVVLPYVALVFTSFLNFLTPRVSLALLSFDNYRDLLEPENFEATKNSLLYSGLGGLVIAFFYIFLSFLIKRSTGQFARVIDYMVIVPTAIPALVLAVGMLWAFVGLPLPIYGTAAILLIAYFVRFIGYGVRQSRAALVQISDELSEAARTLHFHIHGDQRHHPSLQSRDDYLACCALEFHGGRAADPGVRHCRDSGHHHFRRDLHRRSPVRHVAQDAGILRELPIMPVIEVDHLVKSFGQTRAVDDISFSVETAEILVIVGASGCGKTTTLRCIAGLEAPTSGSIRIEGKTVASNDVFVPPEDRGVGMVFQSYALWPHKTVFENIAYGLIIRGMPRAAVRDAVARVVDLVGLQGMEDRYPSTLSGGQQ